MTHNDQGILRLRVPIVAAALALAAGGVLFAHGSEPAQATAPAAIEIADKALSGPGALEDESPYNMIDAIGPSGITQAQATEEVTSRTMMGGLPVPNGSNSGPYGGGQ